MAVSKTVSPLLSLTPKVTVASVSTTTIREAMTHYLPLSRRMYRPTTRQATKARKATCLKAASATKRPSTSLGRSLTMMLQACRPGAAISCWESHLGKYRRLLWLQPTGSTSEGSGLPLLRLSTPRQPALYLPTLPKVASPSRGR